MAVMITPAAFARAARHSLLWLVAALLVVLIPHAPRQPLWVLGCFSVLIIWRLLGTLRGVPLPGARHRRLNAIKHGLALGVFAGVYITYGGVLGRDAGVSLLIVLLGLKVMEMQRPREYYLAGFLGYFLVVTDFFYSQTIATAAYTLFAVTAVTASLIALNDRGGVLPARERVHLAGVMVLQAVPLMLVAFVLFPRVPGPLWGLPRDAYSGLSGLSEEMSPGSLSRLGLSEAPAFRVEFSGNRPSPAELYWRGPVLVQTNGRTWTKGATGDLPPPVLHAEGARYEYTVMLEPHSQRWLFTLEMPAVIPVNARLTRDLRVLAKNPVTQRLQYAAQSYTHTTVNEADQRELYEALRLPEYAHRRAVAMARRWRGQARNPEKVIETALRFFREQPFFYTLAPPPIDGDSVDEFLFNTRRGFCEHYAAAFTVLMRAAGIPARVVTGYQGGEYNPIGDYVLVRQRDAHAWTEVWLGRRGWVRIDPTAAVAPSRIERGIDQVIPPTIAGIPFALEQSPAMIEVWRRLRYSLDAVNNRWNLWVLGYNERRQTEFLSRFGFDTDWRSLSLWLAAFSTLTLAAIAAAVLLGRRRARDPVRSAYDRFCAKLARAGVRRAAHEGPLDFSRRAARLRPQSAELIAAVTDLYVRLRYGGERTGVKTLAEAVRRFQA